MPKFAFKITYLYMAKVQKQNQKKPSSDNSQHKKSFSLISIIPSVPIYLVIFLLYWLFSNYVYADVFYICEQFSLFAFDSVLMKEVMAIWFGPAMYVGRMFLLLFKFPVLGGFVYALILTAISLLISYVFRLRNSWRLFSFIPFAWLMGLMHLGLNVYTRYDSSLIFSFPLVALLLLSVAAVVVKVVTKRSLMRTLKDYSNDKKLFNLSNCLVAIIAFAGLTYMAGTSYLNTVCTAKMQRLLQNQEWEEMIEAAQANKRPSKPVAAYYAIALVHTDQIVDKLFDIYFQYPNINLFNRTGGHDDGTFLFEPDVDLYGGLTNTSYHYNMEHSVTEGLTTYRLKAMCMAAMLNKETKLAYKYMSIIEKIPFEGQFVEKYKPMLYDKSLMASDPMLSRIIELQPHFNRFEEELVRPVFLGYYKTVSEGSKRVVMNSMAASLYTKDLNDFTNILSLFMNEPSVPPTFEQALIVQALRDSNSVFMDHLPEYAKTMTRQILSDARDLGDISVVDKGLNLRDKYTGNYLFYYFYQNIPDASQMDFESEEAAPQQQPTQSQVN